MRERELVLTVNGVSRTVVVDADRILLDVLREDLGLTGAKYGCGMAQCGACTVLVDGVPARSCIMRVCHADGHDIETLEGLSKGDTLHPLQAGFVEMEGAQCGYCLNGMIMTSLALLRRNQDPGTDEISQALRHNLCRCGTHTEIVASVRRAAELMRDTE